MAIDLKTETPDTTIDDSAVLFGADSQSAASPSVYPVSALRDHIEASANVFTTAQTIQPLTDAPALTVRRNSGSQTSNVFQVQTEANAFLAGFDKDGNVTANNLTNGRTIQRFTPLDNQPPATNFATLDTRNSVAVLDFDDGATNEGAVFVGVIPEAAVLTSGIKVRIFWTATSATSGDCEWGAQFEKYGTDIDSDSFDTATFAKTTTSGTSGIANLTEITCTTIDSLAAGDQFRAKIVRNSSNTTDDTMTGDAELIAVELQQVA
jgi:hypothetical protein